MIDKRRVAWLDHIPQLDNLFIEVASPKGMLGFRAILMNGQLSVVDTHHIDDRTVPCFGPECACTTSEHTIGKRTKCYLQGWFPGEARMCLVELTVFAIESYKVQHGRDPVFARGQEIHVFRLNDAKRAPVNFALHKPSQDYGKMPLGFNVEDALVKVWSGETKSARGRRDFRRRS